MTTPNVGDAVQPLRVGPVDPRSMVVWSEVLKDPNPIHLDVAAVTAMGLGSRRILQGPAGLAYLVNGVLLAYPGARIESVADRFVGNVLEDDLLEVSGTVSAVEPTAGGYRLAVDMVLTVDGRGPAVTARIGLVLPP